MAATLFTFFGIKVFVVWKAAFFPLLEEVSTTAISKSSLASNELYIERTELFLSRVKSHSRSRNGSLRCRDALGFIFVLYDETICRMNGTYNNLLNASIKTSFLFKVRMRSHPGLPFLSLESKLLTLSCRRFGESPHGRDCRGRTPIRVFET